MPRGRVRIKYPINYPHDVTKIFVEYDIPSAIQEYMDVSPKAINNEIIIETALIEYNSYLKIVRPVVRDGLVAEWLFFEGQGNILHDTSGKENHGTIYGMTWQQLSNGKWVGYFDGIDDVVVVPDDPSLKFGAGDFSIVVLARIDPATPLHGGLVAKGFAHRAYSVDYRPSYIIRPTYDGRVAFYIEDGTRLAVVEARNMWDGKWHLYIGMRDGDSLRLYVDGVEVDTEDITGFGSTDNDFNLVIGRQHSTGGNYLLGNIGMVYIYGRALSEDEIKQLYDLVKSVVPIG